MTLSKWTASPTVRGKVRPSDSLALNADLGATAHSPACPLSPFSPGSPLSPIRPLSPVSPGEEKERSHEHPLQRWSHTYRWMNHIEHLDLLCPPSVPSPPEQHLSHPSRLSLADQDCHELQESLGYQGDQCTDWEGSCCLLTGWKDGLGGQGGSAAGATAGVRSLLCHKLREERV